MQRISIIYNFNYPMKSEENSHTPSGKYQFLNHPVPLDRINHRQEEIEKETRQNRIMKEDWSGAINQALIHSLFHPQVLKIEVETSLHVSAMNNKHRKLCYCLLSQLSIDIQQNQWCSFCLTENLFFTMKYQEWELSLDKRKFISKKL